MYDYILFHLANYLGALNGDLGCFPLGNEAYPPLPYWLTAYMCNVTLLLLGKQLKRTIYNIILT